MIRWAILCAATLAVHSAAAQTVVCFGDSLTAGVGAPQGSAYPDFLQKDLQAAGYRVTVVNDGIGGDTTDRALPRLEPVLRMHPAVVVLELGANDALENEPQEETKRNLGSMIQALKRARIPVILAGLDGRPFVGQDLPPTLRTPAMERFYGLNAELAQRYGTPLIPFLLQGVYGAQGMMSPDGLHPNAIGYVKVAETVLPYVEAALKQRSRKRR